MSVHSSVGSVLVDFEALIATSTHKHELNAIVVNRCALIRH